MLVQPCQTPTNNPIMCCVLSRPLPVLKESVNYRQIQEK